MRYVYACTTNDTLKARNAFNTPIGKARTVKGAVRIMRDYFDDVHAVFTATVIVTDYGYFMPYYLEQSAERRQLAQFNRE